MRKAYIRVCISILEGHNSSTISNIVIAKVEYKYEYESKSEEYLEY